MYNKGIIFEIKDTYSIVMTESLTMVRIKNRDSMKVGDTIIFLEEDIYIPKKNKISYIKVFSPMIAVAAMFLFFSLSPMFKNTIDAYSLVSFDLNPSIQLELDENKNIIYASGINDQGKSLNLEALNGLSLDDGSVKLKELLENQGYVLKNDTALVGFAFLSNIENVSYENDIKTILANNFNETKILYLKGTTEDLKKSKSQGISLGRYEAELNMDDDFIEDKIENMSVEEISNLLNGNAGIYLNEEILDELKDELDDRLEKDEEEENDDDDSHSDSDNNDDDDNDD